MKINNKENLIDNLIKNNYLKTQTIIDAFNKIDRKDFILEKDINDAYVNYPLSIGFNQTISQPLTVAFMLELLEIQGGEKILDIGVGSGWLTSLIAEIVGNGGKVFGIERIEELKNMAEKNISKYGFLENRIIQIKTGDGAIGWKEEMPFDKIISSASGSMIFKTWKNQLKIGGKIVAPVKNSIIVLDKIGPEKFNKREYFGFTFVPLISTLSTKK